MRKRQNRNPEYSYYIPPLPCNCPKATGTNYRGSTTSLIAVHLVVNGRIRKLGDADDVDIIVL